jgi:hypothetical protein
LFVAGLCLAYNRGFAICDQSFAAQAAIRDFRERCFKGMILPKRSLDLLPAAVSFLKRSFLNKRIERPDAAKLQAALRQALDLRQLPMKG